MRNAMFVTEVPGMEGRADDGWWGRCVWRERGCIVLRVRKVNLVASDEEEALAETGNVLDSSLSPEQLARPGSLAGARGIRCG